MSALFYQHKHGFQEISLSILNWTVHFKLVEVTRVQRSLFLLAGHLLPSHMETPSTSTIEGTPSGEVLLNFRHQEGGRSQAHGQSHGRVVDFPGPTDSTPPGGRLKDLQSQLESLREKESTLQREIATLTSAHNQTLTDQCSIFGTVQGTSGAVRSQLFERTDEIGVPPGSTRGLQHNILGQNTSMADTVQQNSGHSRAQMPNYYDRVDAGINGQLGGTRYDLNYTNSGSGMDLLGSHIPRGQSIWPRTQLEYA